MTIEELKNRKTALGLTNEMIAKAADLPLSTVQKIMSGATKAPRKLTLEAIESALFSEEKRRAEPRLYGSSCCEDSLSRKAQSSAADLSENAGFIYDDLPDHSMKGMVKEALTGYSHSNSAMRRTGEYTLDDYYDLPDNQRVELIDGVFYNMASPSKLHQGVLQGIFVQLDNCIENHRDTCFLYLAPSDVELGDDNNTVVQPDLYIHCSRERELRSPHHGAPDFVLEVLSPSNPQYDLWLKQNLYRRSGVREYWIVDPDGRKILVFDFEHDVLPTSYSFEDEVPVAISNGTCRIDFHKVFARVRHLYTD